MQIISIVCVPKINTSASPAGHGAPKATEPLRRTGDSMGTAVDQRFFYPPEGKFLPLGEFCFGPRVNF